MDSFVSNLGRIYAIYTGSFLAFVIVLAVLEQMGMPDQWIGYAFVLLTIGVYAGIGYISRTAQVSEYYVAGRRVPALLQRHGDGGGLDVRGLVHRHGGLAVSAGL